MVLNISRLIFDPETNTSKKIFPDFHIDDEIKLLNRGEKKIILTNYLLQLFILEILEKMVIILHYLDLFIMEILFISNLRVILYMICEISFNFLNNLRI